MKSLSENYSESHSNTHETFADLVFCALVVLILFVLALTVEVSQRVRAEMASSEPVEEVKAADVVMMTPEQIEELSAKLQSQQQELEQLRNRMQQNESKIESQLSAMQGEQRFTGAREPAGISIAYDFSKDLYYFVPAKEINDADRQRSGESSLEYRSRKTEILASVALQARKQRGFRLAEMQSILQAISGYQTIVPNGERYSVEGENIGIYYHVLLCGFIAGETDLSDAQEFLIEKGIGELSAKGRPSDSMYPSLPVTVNESTRSLTLGGVTMESRELRELLLAVEGRGLLLDFEGYTGSAPSWLYERVLAPAGYVGKTPKLPGQ